MFSFFKSILNSSKVNDANVITAHKNEHENIKNLETTVESTVVENSDSEEAIQVMIAKENIFAEALEHPENVLDAVLKTNPSISLTDCKNELNRLKNDVNKSSQSDGKRSQRKCAKVAARRISKICCKLDDTQAQSLDFKRSQHKRLCAKVAENRISKIIDRISSESDTDEESKISENEMSEAEMNESEISETEMSEAEMNESEMSKADVSHSE